MLLRLAETFQKHFLEMFWDYQQYLYKFPAWILSLQNNTYIFELTEEILHVKTNKPSLGGHFLLYLQVFTTVCSPGCRGFFSKKIYTHFFFVGWQMWLHHLNNHSANSRLSKTLVLANWLRIECILQILSIHNVLVKTNING